MKRLLLSLLMILSLSISARAQGHPNHQDVVARVKAQVQAAGIDINHGPGECGRFEITKRVAWELRNEGSGLMAKFGGQNGCSDHNTTDEPKYGVDIILYSDGTTVDILAGSGGDANTPVWNVIGIGGAALYRPPFDPGNTLPPTPVPTPTNPDLTELTNRVIQLEWAKVELRMAVAQLDRKVDDLRNQMLDQVSNLLAVIANTNSRVDTLEARKIPTSCTAKLGPIGVSCKLN